MRIREIMSTQPACCIPDDSLERVATEMRDRDCGCIPIVEDQSSYRLVAVVTDRDIACRGVATGMAPSTPVRKVMSRDPKACELDDDVATAESIMVEERVRRVPVVNSRNRCVGMVAQADLARDRRSASEDQVGRIIQRISEPALSH